MWGAGEVGQLGTSNRINECKPQMIKRIIQSSERIKEIALGYFHSLILTDTGRVLQTGLSTLQLKIEAHTNNFYTTFTEVICLKSQRNIQSIKAKELSVAMTTSGELYIWSDTYHYDTLGPKQLTLNHSLGTKFDLNSLYVHDFELCRDSMIVRCDDTFYQYNFEHKHLDSFENGQFNINDLSILSCGHSYIIGVQTKRHKSSRQKSDNKSHKKISLRHSNSQGRFDKKKAHRSQREAESQYEGDGNSTQVRKLSSNRMTRSGSKGEVLYSNYTNDNIGSSFLNGQLNSNSKLNNKKVQLSSSCSQVLQAVPFRTQHQPSVIFDEEMEDNNDSCNGKRNSQLCHSSLRKLKKTNSRVCFNDKSNIHYADSSNKKTNQLSQTKDHVTSTIVPKSMRISYEEVNNGKITSGQMSYRQNENQSRHEYQSREQSPEYNNLRFKYPLDQSQPRPSQISDDLSRYHQNSALSEKKRTSKDKMKDALKKEIRQRLLIEQQLQQIKIEFEKFKADVGVDQMKKVLVESQQEYQKLYEICIQECEKANKYSDLYKKERNIREERENQIMHLGDQEEMFKNQIGHLEHQLTLLRDQKDTEQASFKQTVLDQQKALSDLRDQSHYEKERLQEKAFDLEENNHQLREEIAQLKEQYTGTMMIEKQNNQILSRQNQELKEQLQERVDGEQQEIEKQQMRVEIAKLQNTVQSKQQNIKEYDALFAQMREKEQEYISQIKKIELQPVQIIQPVKQNPSQNSFAKERVLSANKVSSINPVKRQNGASSARPDNKVQNPKILCQTNKSNSSSTYQTRQSSTKQTAQIQEKTGRNDIKQKKTKESSPEKLQQIIVSQENKNQKFFNEISKIAGINRVPELQIQQHKQVQPNKKSRSSSPMDYLGLKPKANNFIPRLQSSSSVGSHTSRAQGKQINLNQSRNTKGTLHSPKILENKTYEEEFATPSQCSLAITPVIQSSRGNNNNIGNMNATYVASQNNQSIFDNELESKGFMSGMSSNKGSGYIQTQNLSKSFDGMKNPNGKKQVKFLIDSKKQEQLQTSEDNLNPENDTQVQGKMKEEEEIEKLYESLATDMKNIKGQNVDNLKGKLEAIRKNKTQLEDKIKQYERKLGK